MWDVFIAFVQGERHHRVQLEQDGNVIAGSQTSYQFEGPVTGHVDEAGVHLVFSAWHEGTLIAYRLDGRFLDGQAQGNVTLGSATHHHQGPINLAQFGSARFSAVRAEEA